MRHCNILSLCPGHDPHTLRPTHTLIPRRTCADWLSAVSCSLPQRRVAWCAGPAPNHGRSVAARSRWESTPSITAQCLLLHSPAACRPTCARNARSAVCCHLWGARVVNSTGTFCQSGCLARATGIALLSVSRRVGRWRPWHLRTLAPSTSCSTGALCVAVGWLSRAALDSITDCVCGSAASPWRPQAHTSFQRESYNTSACTCTSTGIESHIISAPLHSSRIRRLLAAVTAVCVSAARHVVRLGRFWAAPPAPATRRE